MSDDQMEVAPVATEAAKPAKKKWKQRTSKTKARRYPAAYARPSYITCKKHWPDIFTSSRARPLALGITDKLIAEAQAKGIEELHPDVIRAAVQRLTEKDKYLQSIIDGDYRYNIDGSQAEAIEASHKNHARICLKLNIRRREKYRKEQAAAAAEAVDQIAKDTEATLVTP